MQESEEAEASALSDAPLDSWVRVQDNLKEKLITHDDVPWRVEAESESEKVVLRYVGGVDISFSKEDSSLACGCLVVLELPSLRVVHQDMAVVSLGVPYVPGFLAFREAPVLLRLLDNMKRNRNPFYPQVLMVDGNGVLHPRGFGLACHLGVIADMPTIGVGKNLHHVDGLTQARVRQLLESDENKDKTIISLRGNSGFVWGVGMRLTTRSLKPIFISVGHQLSLDTAIKVVKLTCKYRVPEPIRQADMRSRAHLHKNRKKLECWDLSIKARHSREVGTVDLTIVHFNKIDLSQEFSQEWYMQQLKAFKNEIHASTFYSPFQDSRATPRSLST